MLSRAGIDRVIRIGLVAGGGMVAATALLVIVDWNLSFKGTAFPLPDHGEIVIEAVPDPGMDTLPALTYLVRRNGGIVGPKCHFGTLTSDKQHPAFLLLVVDDESVCAVYEESNPFHLYVLYDVRSGERWPFNDGKGGYPTARAAKVGGRLVRRIRKALGDERYRFGYYGESPLAESFE